MLGIKIGFKYEYRRIQTQALDNGNKTGKNKWTAFIKYVQKGDEVK